jgi:CDGSH-type Zn-finger protein
VGTDKEEKIDKAGFEQEIKVTKNGPYIVSGALPISEQIITVDKEGVPVKWRLGKRYPLQKKCGLCRCGESKNKPYCDGTHAKIGFDGTEVVSIEPYLQEAKITQGPTLKLTDVEGLCASARFCHRAGEIWNLIPKSDDANARRLAIEEARDCPSGRLVVCDTKTGVDLESQLEKSIGLIEDPQMQCSGPIWVQGCIPVRSADGTIYRVRNRVTLCRCGKSSIKPFCDSSHFPEHRYEEMMSRK